MADLKGAGFDLVDLDAFESLLSLVRSRADMEAVWAGYRDGDDVVVAVSCGDVTRFGIEPGTRFRWRDSLVACAMDDEERSRGADGNRDRGVVSDGITYLCELASDPQGDIPIGIVCLQSTSLQCRLPQAVLKDFASIAKVFGQLIAPVARVDGRRRELFEKLTTEINDERLTSVFQPIFSISQGEVLGAEALTRFSCAPARPDVWFRDAASIGLGVELELAAVRCALRSLDSLPPDKYLAINVSPEMLEDPRLRDLLMGSVPSRIVLELTEHDAVEDYVAIRRRLREYRDLGCRFAVDDVGAGFASFSHVLSLRPDIVKIDLSLTRGVDLDLARRALIKAIVDIARSIDATVIAEGIETRDELETLFELGVDRAQGFLLGKPGPLPLPAIAPEIVGTAPLAQRPWLDRSGDPTAAERFEVALRFSPIGMAIVGLDGSFLHTNESLVAMLGYSAADLGAMTFQDLTHPDDLDQDLDLLMQCLSGERDSYRIDKRYITSLGTTVWSDLSVAIVRSDNGDPLYFVSQIQDVTERRQLERDLAVRATTDPLTGMMNRTAATDRIKYLIDHSRPFGVMFCDLDDFKSINDELGHQAGDEVLIEVAERLRILARADDVVARWGGDEFVVVLADIDADSLDGAAQRIHASVAQPITIGATGNVRTPRITTGTAFHSPFGDGCLITDSAEKIVRRADQAMYERKQASPRRLTARSGV